MAGCAGRSERAAKMPPGKHCTYECIVRKYSVFPCLLQPIRVFGHFVPTGEEDCLTLNVYVPEIDEKEKVKYMYSRYNFGCVNVG